MQINEKKKYFSRNFLSNEKILTFFLLVIIILLSVPLYNNYHRRQKINREIGDLESEIKSAENKDTELQKLIKYLESDQFVEEQARLNLNMKKPGESVAVINETPQAGGDNGSRQIISSNLIPAGASRSAGYATSWWHYFFK